jgi:hypothetical protein
MVHQPQETKHMEMSSDRLEVDVENIQQTCPLGWELSPVSLNGLLAIHTRVDASHSPEGAHEVRHIAVSQSIRNLSYGHRGNLQ